MTFGTTLVYYLIPESNQRWYCTLYKSLLLFWYIKVSCINTQQRVPSIARHRANFMLACKFSFTTTLFLALTASTCSNDLTRALHSSLHAGFGKSHVDGIRDNQIAGGLKKIRIIPRYFYVYTGTTHSVRPATHHLCSSYYYLIRWKSGSVINPYSANVDNMASSYQC